MRIQKGKLVPRCQRAIRCVCTAKYAVFITGFVDLGETRWETNCSSRRFHRAIADRERDNAIGAHSSAL